MTSEVSEVHSEAPTFEGVARLVAEKEDDVEWLADGVRSWIWPQERWPQGVREFGSDLGMFADLARVRWSRTRLLKALKETLPERRERLNRDAGGLAADALPHCRTAWPGFGPLEQVALAKLLHQICRRCGEASRFSEIVSADGKAKAGSEQGTGARAGRRKGGLCEHRSGRVEVRSRKAARPACQASCPGRRSSIRARNGPAGRFDLVARRQGWGEDPLKAWPPHFKAAIAPNPVLDRLNEMVFVQDAQIVP